MSAPGLEISRTEEGSGGRYLAAVEGHEAELTYSRANARLIIIDHTGVPDALRGRGIGNALVRRAVEDARASDTKIIPLCTFAAAQFRRHPEYADVLSR